MPDAIVRVNGEQDLRIRINGPDPTFHLGGERICAAALTELDDFSLDFMEIAATVFAADGSISRGDKYRNDFGGKWHRCFDIRLPVRRPEFWSEPDVRELLVETCGFLTEDTFRFEFSRAAPSVESEPYLPLEAGGPAFRADEVILFSGGLDSLAGALETLGTTGKNVVLVTHRSAQKVYSRQERLGQYLLKKHSGRVLHVIIPAHRKGVRARDDTQRSRTLLFSAMGQAVARTFGATSISFYENGIVSHNLPLSDQIVGTMATRTTHPYSLHLVRELAAKIWPEGPSIENRFEWLTKTDVARKVADHGAAAQIPIAVSCTSVRQQANAFTHCGSCSQCLDRRFAMIAAGLADQDKQADYRIDVLFGSRPEGRTRAIAVEWVRHALGFEDVTPTSAMTRFGLELGRILIGHSSLTARDALNRTLDMHRRQAETVKSVLEWAIRERAPDLLKQALPPDCLLMLHLGDGRAVAAPSVPVPAPVPHSAARGDDGDDMVHVLGAPLRVAFYHEGSIPVVDIVGLGTVQRKPALVAHALKKGFDQDRAEGITPDDHRYFVAKRIPLDVPLSDTAIRQAIGRCRKELAEFHEAIHGCPPKHDLLIHHRRAKGYRLDPETTIVSRNRAGGFIAK